MSNNQTDEQNEIQKDLGIAKDMEAVANSKGGKLLIESLSADIIGNIERISSGYDERTLQEFISLAAKIEVNLDLYKTIAGATENKKALIKIFKDSLL